MREIILSIGGVSISLKSKDENILGCVRNSFSGFLDPSGRKPVIKVELFYDEQFKDINPYSFGNPHMINVAKAGEKMFVRGSIYKGVFDPSSLEGQIWQGVSSSPVYLFLRFILSVYLPQLDGFFLHSSSIARDGRAYLFSGPPQSGKSTVARLSANFNVLSDDFSLVRSVGGKFSCFGSPFWGHVEAKGANLKNKGGCCSIKGLYLLKQDNETYLRKIPKKEAHLLLMQNISIIARDRGVNLRILDLADKFTDTVAVYSLHFKLDNSFWRCIEDA